MLLTLIWEHVKLIKSLLERPTNCSLKTEQTNVNNNRFIINIIKRKQVIQKLEFSNELINSLLESLILAQDERWRRA